MRCISSPVWNCRKNFVGNESKRFQSAASVAISKCELIRRTAIERTREIAAVVKPTTIILDDATGVASNLVAEDGSLAMRVTYEAFSKQLCYRFQKPIVSTSANVSGEPAAQNYRDISPEILEAVDYVCWTRRQEHKPHQPSSIVKIGKNGEVKVIR